MKRKKKERHEYRGSRKHVLDWVESPAFLNELSKLLAPIPVQIASDAAFMPRGYSAPSEARLDQRTAKFEVIGPLRETLRDWWLKHQRGANTPNWDLVVESNIEGRRGLILVEAKANHPELKVEGKPLSDDASDNSRDNDRQIRAAIETACKGLNAAGYAVSISADENYQLSNRLAFMWKLASLGIPTVLLYLGFTGDEGLRDAGEPFENHEDWSTELSRHTQKCFPSSQWNLRLNVNGTPAWFLVRSREVMELSPPA
jgi:hypothetical protein